MFTVNCVIRLQGGHGQIHIYICIYAVHIYKMVSSAYIGVRSAMEP